MTLLVLLEKASIMNKLNLLRYSIAIIFLLFGGLKLFPQLSPAEIIGVETVDRLTNGFFSKDVCIYALAIFEIIIGASLLFERWIRISVPLAIIHLCLTFTPFLFFPGEVFNLSVYSLSLLGQYILKNIVIISALLILYPTKSTYQQINISN